MSSFRLRCRNELRTFHLGAAIGTAIFLVAVWLIVLFIVGSPRILLHFASGHIVVLPSWLFLTLTIVFYGIAGFSIGAVLFECRRVNETSKYRGAFFFSIAITASYLWYALTFGARFFLPALLLAAIFTLGFVIAAVNFRRVVRLASHGMWIAAIWGAYLFLLSLLFFFFL